MKSLLFIVVLSLLAVGYARDQEEELAIRSQYVIYKGNSCKKNEGRCIKGKYKPCPNGYEACGLSCGKGKKNKNKRCCCLLYLPPILEPSNSCTKKGGVCIKGRYKPCPNGFEACGRCGKGKKNKKKRCCCLLYLPPTREPSA